MGAIYKDFCFYLSCDLALDVKVYVDHLDITHLPLAMHEQAEDLLVSVRLIDGGIPLSSGFRSTHVPYRRGRIVCWNEWLTLPVKIRDLPHTAQLVVELWGVGMRLLGGSTMRVFDHRMRLKRGMQQLVVWPHMCSRPAAAAAAKIAAVDAALPPPTVPLIRADHTFHLLKLVEQYELAETARTPWVDRITFAQLSRELSGVWRNERAAGGRRRRRRFSCTSLARASMESASSLQLAANPSSGPATAAQQLDQGAAALDARARGGGGGGGPASSSPLHLYLHMPAFDVPVIYEDSTYAGAAAAGPVPPAVMRPPHPALAAAAATAAAVTVPMPVPSSLLMGYAPSAAATAAVAGGGPSSSGGAAASQQQQAGGQAGAAPAAAGGGSAAGAVVGAVGGFEHSRTAAGGGFGVTPSLSTAAASAAAAAAGGGPGGSGSSAAGGGGSGGGCGLIVPFWNEGETLALIADPEAEAASNPVELKYSRLARSQMRNMVDTNLKPNRAELARIQAAVAAPTLDSRLAPESRDLLWKFRYSLTGSKKALTKFLLCVDWEDEEDAAEAVALLAKWAPIDTEDALRLLSHDYRARAVREHAAHALRRASDAELELYLLQLVQALRYEPDLLAAAAAPPQPPAPGGGAVAAGGRASGGGGGRRGGGGGSAPSTPLPAVAAVGAVSAADTYAHAPKDGSGGVGAYALSPLADLLLERGAASLELGNFLHWYLTVELEDARLGGVYARVHSAFLDRLMAPPPQDEEGSGGTAAAVGPQIAESIMAQGVFFQQLAAAAAAATGSRKDSVQTKIEKLNAMLAPGGAYGELCALAEPVTAPLNPLVLVGGVVPRGCRIFKSALYPTVITLAVHAASRLDWTKPPATAGLTIHPAAAEAARAALDALAARRAAQLSGGRSRGARAGGAAGSAAASPGGAGDTSGTRDQFSPAAADAAVAGSHRSPLGSLGGSEDDAAAASQSAAAVAAAVREAAVASGAAAASYKIIFKNGDDLRQDQLIIQMIRLMDQQLKRVGLDLRLTPYRVLPTSTTTGMMEMVLDSEPVSAVMYNYRSDIMAFFRAHHPQEGAEYGIDPATMDTYVRSCAGYCVITYLLGVGDRHLDNIMLRKDGHLFHLDFGYIFGRDPKPLPPPMRLTKEMIEGMGGPESNNYTRFKTYSCQAYNILRKSANLVLCLLGLMRDAGLEAFADAPDLVIAKLQDKFRLDIDDEAADQVFLKLIDESVAAMFPAFFEVVHKIRVAMR